jgi:hypothetical protein
MFRKGDEAYALQLQKKNRWVDGLLREFLDAHWMIIKKIKRVKERNIPAGDNPRYKIEKMTYSGSEAEWYLADTWRNIIKPLEDVGLRWEDFGLQLYLERIAGERANYANPQGWTPRIAKKKIEELKQIRTSGQLHAIDDAVIAFRDLRNYVIEKGEKASRWSADMIKMMKDTPEYATFDVVKYIEKRHGRAPSAKIYKQIGTFEDIANPATATVLKDIAIIKAINRQEAAESVVKFLKKHYPGEIREADKRWNGKFQEIRNPSDPDLGLIVYLQNGKPKGHYVDKWIADSFDSNPREGQFLGKLLATTVQPFRMIFTELNPGFWLFNINRDFWRLMTTLPKTKIRTFVPHYLKAIKPAMKSVYGIPDNVVKEMLKDNMLISVADIRGVGAADSEIEKMLRRYHIKKQTWDNKIVRPFGQFFTYYTNIGRGLERTPKIAANTYLKEKFPDMSEELRGHIVRVRGGSPDFLRKGRLYPVYNNFLLFSNAIKEGYRGDYEALSDNPSEFMWKKAKYTFLPKFLMYAAQIGLLGAGTKAIMEGVSEYDKTNYTIIPLGLTQTGKSVYLRVPIDETSRMMGGILWKSLSRDTEKMTTGLFDYMAGQAPTIHPGVDVLIASIQYASGLNPYDSFRGRYAIPEQTFQAGGERSHKAFLKWLANKSGSTIIYRFKYDDIDRITTELEDALAYPFASNIVGRFLKVSDQGIKEEIKELKFDVRKSRVREVLDVKDALTKWVNGEELSEKEKSLIEKNPDLIGRNLMVQMSKRYGYIFIEEFATATSTEEKGAVFRRWIDRQKLLKEIYGKEKE